jgi:hypothetical protein
MNATLPCPWGWAGGPQTGRADGRAAGLLRADADVAAGREVRIGAGQRPAEAERVDDGRAGGGSVAGPDAAAAEPDVVGRDGGDERGPAVRRGRAGGCGEPARLRAGRAVIAAIDETGQQKAGTATAGVKRHYMGARAGWPMASPRCTCRWCGTR